MSDDLNRRQAFALLDSAAREIAAARTLLGGDPAGESAPVSARDVVSQARQTPGAACPSCGAKNTQQRFTPFGGGGEQVLCGGCGYEYPTS